MSVEVRDEDDHVEPQKLIGQVLANRYRIESRIGEGAMGAVYKAKHVKVGRAFAVKVLHARLLEDKKVLHRFEREAELAGRLRHPNVIGVVDVGELPDDTRYMVMDFAAGPDLATLLSEAPMPAARIIHLTRQMLEGLYHAHEAGLIHRDFKPENVIVEHDTHGAEVPRIVDFGIAILREGGDSSSSPGRITTNGLVLGTPHYMAPEQAVADPIDHRIDLFALGIMVYEMLSGKLPFDGTGAEVARANLLLDPPRIIDRVPFLEVDPLLEAFARRMMAKKRDLRPANAKVARELLDLIERDRGAAAAALGVPLDTVRMPATTQPIQPRGKPAETDAPPARSALETPAQAPPMTAPVAVAAPIDRQKAIETEPVRKPATKRSRWPLAAFGVLVLGGGGFAAYRMLDSSASSPNASGPVATSEPAPPAPVEVKPAPVEPAKPPPAEVKSQEPPPAPPPVEVSSPPVTKPPPHVVHPTKGAGTKSRGTKPPVTTTPAVVAQPEVKPAETKPVETKPAVTQPEVKPPEAKPPEAMAMDSATLARRYQEVGIALKKIAVAKGDSAVSDLAARYSLIKITDAMSTQAKIDATAATLAAIQRELQSR